MQIAESYTNSIIAEKHFSKGSLTKRPSSNDDNNIEVTAFSKKKTISQTQRAHK
jgi:hypothetical protein